MRKKRKRQKEWLVNMYVCGRAMSDMQIGIPRTDVYKNVTALKKGRTCWKECGIDLVEVRRVRAVLKGK